ncbi:hypothetical protein N7532_002721 [Penicillium argentinense]|uniref:Uncharacterized protein n=1 Tax=Penicillium argentinense TaxID=1131581 RepID=A0A9W9G135_9EURO|nr:uncharacterized protein N7532_002721 [Penicillium argentinense]KAJ5110076.1 hypothetical protein N7532_002721 [Penicillium argentinense]
MSSMNKSKAAPEQGKYGSLQVSGALCRRWLADPDYEGCYIITSPQDLSYLQSNPRLRAQMEPKIHNIHGELHQQVVELGLPNEFDAPVEKGKSVYRNYTIRHGSLTWVGTIGPGIVVLAEIQRSSHPMWNAPYISQITQALYAQCYDLAGLRHIIITNIQEDETSALIEDHILLWPDKGPYTWEIGTPEYDALLGTRLGKVAAYVLLGALPRGTRRISQITLWGCDAPGADMRFDIEAV